MEWPDVDHAVFGISVAAELAGLHPQTLRVYEREGLIEPSRSAGGTRRYSGQDVERLRVIGSLTASGVNLPGVKRVLELQAELLELRAMVVELESQLERERKPKHSS